MEYFGCSLWKSQILNEKLLFKIQTENTGTIFSWPGNISGTMIHGFWCLLQSPSSLTYLLQLHQTMTASVYYWPYSWKEDGGFISRTPSTLFAGSNNEKYREDLWQYYQRFITDPAPQYWLPLGIATHKYEQNFPP